MTFKSSWLTTLFRVLSVSPWFHSTRPIIRCWQHPTSTTTCHGTLSSCSWHTCTSTMIQQTHHWGPLGTTHKQIEANCDHSPSSVQELVYHIEESGPGWSRMQISWQVHIPLLQSKLTGQIPHQAICYSWVQQWLHEWIWSLHRSRLHRQNPELVGCTCR